jgi:hypothetical protein
MSIKTRTRISANRGVVTDTVPEGSNLPILEIEGPVTIDGEEIGGTGFEQESWTQGLVGEGNTGNVEFEVYSENPEQDGVDFFNIEKIKLNAESSDGKDLSKFFFNLRSNAENGTKYELDLHKADNESIGGIFDVKTIECDNDSNHMYRGVNAISCRFWGDDPSVNQLFMYFDSRRLPAKISQDTNSDDLSIEGLRGTGGFHYVVLYGTGSASPYSTDQLTSFFHSYVDHVLYGGAPVIDTDLESVASKFYLSGTYEALIASLTSSLYQNFDFDLYADYNRNNIDDGGDDQYDNGNILNTEYLKAIPYASGTLVTGSIAFGPNSNQYLVAYTGSIFAMFVNNGGANNFYLRGDMGADGEGFKSLDYLTKPNYFTLEVDPIEASGNVALNDGSNCLASFKVGAAKGDITKFNLNGRKIKNFSGGENLSVKGSDLVAWFETDRLFGSSDADDYQGAIINYNAHATGPIGNLDSIGTIYMFANNPVQVISTSFGNTPEAFNIIEPIGEGGTGLTFAVSGAADNDMHTLNIQYDAKAFFFDD